MSTPTPTRPSAARIAIAVALSGLYAVAIGLALFILGFNTNIGPTLNTGMGDATLLAAAALTYPAWGVLVFAGLTTVNVKREYRDAAGPAASDRNDPVAGRPSTVALVWAVARGIFHTVLFAAVLWFGGLVWEPGALAVWNVAMSPLWSLPVFAAFIALNVAHTFRSHRKGAIA